MDMQNLQVENFDSQNSEENFQSSRFTFKNFLNWYISPKTRSLYLWTKKGAARHCKMLGTEKAWEVFEMMEDAYFYVQELKQKEMSADIEQKFPSTLSTNQLDRIEQQLQELSDDVTNIRKYLKIVTQALS